MMLSFPSSTKTPKKHKASSALSSEISLDNSNIEHKRPSTYHKLHKNKLMAIMDYYEKNKYPKRLQILELSQTLGEDPVKIKNHFKYIRRKELRRNKSGSSELNFNTSERRHDSNESRRKRSSIESSTHFSDETERKELSAQELRETKMNSICEQSNKDHNHDLHSHSLFTDLETLLGDGLLSKIMDTNGYDLTLEKSNEWEEYKKTVGVISDQMRLLREYDRLIENNQNLISSISNEIEIVRKDNEQLITEINQCLSKRMAAEAQIRRETEVINESEEHNPNNQVEMCFNEDVYLSKENEDINLEYN